jgi:hypothetical protein
VVAILVLLSWGASRALPYVHERWRGINGTLIAGVLLVVVLGTAKALTMNQSGGLTLGALFERSRVVTVLLLLASCALLEYLKPGLIVTLTPVVLTGLLGIAFYRWLRGYCSTRIFATTVLILATAMLLYLKEIKIHQIGSSVLWILIVLVAILLAFPINRQRSV